VCGIGTNETVACAPVVDRVCEDRTLPEIRLTDKDMDAGPYSVLNPFELAVALGHGDRTEAYDLTPNGNGTYTTLTDRIVRSSPTIGFINITPPYAANMSIVGNHTVLYSVSDDAGNEATASRIVAVIFVNMLDASSKQSDSIAGIGAGVAGAGVVLGLLFFIVNRTSKSETDANAGGAAWIQENPTFTMDARTEPPQVTWRVAGKMSRHEAEAEIRSMNTVNPQGCFLLRESTSASTESSLPVLSVCCTEDGKMRHHRITIDAAGTFALNGRVVSTGPTLTNLNRFISFLGSADPAAAAYKVGCRLNLDATYSPPVTCRPQPSSVASQESLYTEADPNQPKVYDDLAEQKSQRRAKAMGGPKRNNARNSQPEAPPRRLSSVSLQLSSTLSDIEDDATGGGGRRSGGDGSGAVKSETLYATAFDSDDEDPAYINNAAARDVPQEYTTLGVGSEVYAGFDGHDGDAHGAPPAYSALGEGSGVYAPGTINTAVPTVRPVAAHYVNEKTKASGGAGASDSDDAEIDC